MTRRLVWRLFVGGVGLASVVLIATARRLITPLGRPTAFQIATLVAAVLIEVSVIAGLDRWLRTVQERQRTLVVLIIVGAHFVLMAPAFGPTIAVLGLLSIVNAVAALRATEIRLSTAWFLDGALKASIGGLMFWYARESRGNTAPEVIETKAILYGWEAGIRTPITWSRATCPTVERPPSLARVRGRNLLF
jgi:hypothetical protein